MLGKLLKYDLKYMLKNINASPITLNNLVNKANTIVNT